MFTKFKPLWLPALLMALASQCAFGQEGVASAGSTRVTEAVTQFDASGLAAGTYLLNIVNADGVLVRTFKVMKK